MNTINYNINVFKLAVSTQIKDDDSAMHVQDFRVLNYRRSLILNQKYLMSGGNFPPWIGIL